MMQKKAASIFFKNLTHVHIRVILGEFIISFYFVPAG